VGVLAVSARAHTTGTLDRTLITTLALASLAAFEAAAVLPAAARDLSSTLTGGRRVLEILDRRPVVQDPPAPCAPPAGADVSIEDVTARYGGDLPPAVAGLTIDLPAGRRIAVTGASGAGKTTVANLLLRFLDPDHGRVRLDGRDLRDYRQHDVRAMFAYAGQDSHIFDSTIRANLELGRAGASDTDLEAALEVVRLDGWVADLPDGLDTRVGDDGAALSGGQRQRLGIARALLSDAPVLLLDEPAAHLDGPTAEAVIGDILRTAEGRSVLLITHRPEGLDLVDEVVELSDGAVIDRVRGPRSQ
jgi:ABC-type transport system involved in cytochrome bd biosynthesis fused ATPase/permease subunit